MAVALSHYILEQIVAQKTLTDYDPIPCLFGCPSLFSILVASQSQTTVPHLGNHISCYIVSTQWSLNCDAILWIVKGLEHFQ